MVFPKICLMETLKLFFGTGDNDQGGWFEIDFSESLKGVYINNLQIHAGGDKYATTYNLIVNEYQVINIAGYPSSNWHTFNINGYLNTVKLDYVNTRFGRGGAGIAAFKVNEKC